MIRISIVLLYLLSPFPAIGITYSVNPTAYQTAKGLLPMVLGSVAYTWLMAELVISARPKFIEKYFGLNHFYRFHAIAAIVAITLSFVHKQLEDTIWTGFLHPARQIGNDALILFIVLAGLSLFFMTSMIIRRLPFLTAFRHYLERKRIVDFNISVWIHNANVIAIVLVFLHVFIISAFYQQNPWICGIYTLYFIIAISYYIYHKFVKIRLAKISPYKLAEIKEESFNVHTLVFTPANGRLPRYKAGQFVFLRLLAKGISDEEHPFSLTSDPNDRSALSVTIKSIGDYTQRITEIPANAQAILEGPFGILGNSVHRTKSDLVLIAGGIGITPMLSILKDLRQTDSQRHVLLFWNISTKKDLIFKNLFATISRQMPYFTLVPILSREAAYAGETGHLNREKLIRHLRAHRYNVRRTHYIICGPAKMMNSVVESLHLLNVDRKRIHFENFSL
ncbi:MAG: hypothetical protein ABF651_05350 [Sporolactobacillus sp.]